MDWKLKLIAWSATHKNDKGFSGLIAGIIGLVITLVVTVAILPVALTTLETQTTINGSVKSLFNVVPILIPVVIIMAAIGYMAFR